MSDLSKLFWNASIQDLKNGFIYEESKEQYLCLVCGQTFTQGIIFPFKNALYDAKKMIKHHIQEAHNSMFIYLLNMDKKFTGFTEYQKELMIYFKEGHSDKEIAEKLDGKNLSTIRNNRFNLRQKEKQAKIQLAILELLNESSDCDFIHIHKSAVMVDDRYDITNKEEQKVLEQHFKGTKLLHFPKKQKKKLIILRHITTKLDGEKKYTEKEINNILKNIYEDYVTIRRYLIEYGFLDRVADGSSYWVKK